MVSLSIIIKSDLDNRFQYIYCNKVISKLKIALLINHYDICLFNKYNRIKNKVNQVLID